MNKMKEIRVRKVTANMGVGQSGEELEKAATILKTITKRKPVKTLCKVKQPAWGIKENLPIGVKVTMRRERAGEFLKETLLAKENVLSKKCFDRNGNFGFGVKEYIDMPNIKYDPKLGIRGFDVLVTIDRPGYRIKRRKIDKKKIPVKHAVKKEEAIEFVKNRFGVEIQ